MISPTSNEVGFFVSIRVPAAQLAEASRCKERIHQNDWEFNQNALNMGSQARGCPWLAEEAIEAVDKTIQEIELNTVKHWSSHLKWERIDNE